MFSFCVLTSWYINEIKKFGSRSDSHLKGDCHFEFLREDSVHELMNRLADEVVVEFGVAVEREGDVGVEHSQKGGGVGLVTRLHVAVVSGGFQEEGFENLLLPFVNLGDGFEGVALGGGKPH